MTVFFFYNKFASWSDNLPIMVSNYPFRVNDA